VHTLYINDNHNIFRKSGLFRSFSLDRKGPYTLRVKLVAGDLKLVR
jgi:hypothetical protein